jgi:AraC-like DNA-binding protein
MIEQLHGWKYFSQTGIPLSVFRTQVGSRIAMHTHDFSELAVVLDGHGWHVTTDSKYRIAAGDVFVVQNNAAHAYEGCEQIDLYNVLFDTSKLNLPASDLYQLPAYHALFSLEPGIRNTARSSHHFLTLSRHDLAEISSILGRAADELLQRQPGYQGMAVSLFVQAAVSLSRCYACMEGRESGRLIRLGRVISYIEQNILDDLTLGQMAGVAGVSASTLNRSFNDALGMPPMEYVIEQRFKRAIVLLKDTDATITQVACRSGFADSNFFARQFRRRFGCSPREFRAGRYPLR